MSAMEGNPSTPIRGNAERLYETAGQLELHAIYNRHEDVAEAIQAVSYIENDSTVYLEGIRFISIDEPSLWDEIEAIGKYKREFGKDKTYFKMKQECLDYMNEYLKTRGYGAENFDPYTTTKYRLLLEKDCEVISADYRHQVSPTSQEKADKLTARVKRTIGDRQHDIFRSVDSESDIDDRLRKLKQLVYNDYKVHDMRERIATDRILSDVKDIIDSPAASMNAIRSESGKIKSYLIYGTAHARSLTKKLTDQNVEVIVYEPVPLRSAQYLDFDQKTFRQNCAKRLAITALSGLSRQLIVDPEDAQYDGVYYGTMDYVYETVDNMEFDQIQGLSLARQCLHLMKTFNDDPDETRKQYLDLLRM